MKILSVVGARPQFVKLAPIAHEIERRGLGHVVVHTGQHYDANMSDAFFRDLKIPQPAVNLAVGSAKHGAQTGLMMMGLEPVFEEQRPDWILAYGDTNSTLAAALCATKLQIPLAHLEAGLRSFNRSMPEEHNRILTDHSADLCLAPTEAAMGHLAREGLADKSMLVGDVMTDVLVRTAKQVIESPVYSPIAKGGEQYYFATIHRPSNTDSLEQLVGIMNALRSLPLTVYLAAHPRLVSRAETHGISLSGGNVRSVPPLSYPQLVQAVVGSSGVITDSGGLQKEAFLLGVVTTTVRPDTEWVETLADGWNELVGKPQDIASSVTRQRPEQQRGAPYGDGNSAPRVVSCLVDDV